MADLNVELYDQHIGRIRGTDRRTFDFIVDSGALERFGVGSTVLSESIPFVPVSPRAGAARRRNFFSELLPEGEILRNLALQARVDQGDIVAVLARYGRDVAGAVQIWDPERPGEPRTPRIEPLTLRGVGDLLLSTQASPLGNSAISGKSSLNGMQDKVVLALVEGVWHRVLDGYPSTHIVKPETRTNPTTIFDEEYGARIARAVALLRYDVSLVDFSGVTGLAIERYDRSPDSPSGRIHQEDMNQALGASGNEKYQELGGRITLRRIAELFSRRGDDDSLRRLLELTTLSVAVGNLDMHAKNIAVLHFLDGTSTLAPAYDVVPQTHQANDGKLALAVNNVYVHKALTRADLVAEARTWRLQKPEHIVDDVLARILAAVRSEEPDKRSHPTVRDDIERFTQNLIAGRAAGERAAAR